MYVLLLIRQHLIPVVLSALVSVIVFLLFVDVSHQNKTITKERINPYVLSTQGKTIVKSGDGATATLDAQQKKEIRSDDRIRTLANSAATIFWADGSVTRLGEKTNVSVLELKTNPNQSTQVDFSISEGKSWSNLARSLDPDSYFKQRFDNDQKVAAVRGTVFEVNVEKGYVHTESHAVVIQDEKGGYLATVADGTSVTTEGSVEPLSDAATDTKWRTANMENDTMLTQERVKKIKEKLQSLTNRDNIVIQVQKYLRSLFGIDSLDLPIEVNTTGSGISLSIDAKRLKSENAQELLAVYEAMSLLNTSDDTVDAKVKLREAILQTLPEKDAKAYEEMFSRATLFDSWDAVKNNLPKSSTELRGYLEKYTKGSANTEEILQLQKSLPMDRINQFNDQMQKWKDLGYDTLSDPEWFSKTFKVDGDGIMKQINLFNQKVDTAVK